MNQRIITFYRAEMHSLRWCGDQKRKKSSTNSPNVNRGAAESLTSIKVSRQKEEDKFDPFNLGIASPPAHAFWSIQFDFQTFPFWGLLADDDDGAFPINSSMHKTRFA